LLLLHFLSALASASPRAAAAAAWLLLRLQVCPQMWQLQRPCYSHLLLLLQQLLLCLHGPSCPSSFWLP
jgi:hypothetical protein